jgi:hypothetical protein
MFKSNLNEYKNGWLLGNFSPAVIQTSDFKALTNCIVLVIKFPSLPEDKVLA